jgi:outer membrane protein OmpA-like peptidoglycan-associated protein
MDDYPDIVPEEDFGPGDNQAATRADGVDGSPFARVHSAQRSRRRRLAIGIAIGTFLGLLAIMNTVHRDTFERDLAKQAQAALGNPAYAGVRVAADGRKVILSGTVASEGDLTSARELVKAINFVVDVDDTKLIVGEPVGGLLPLRAVFSEDSVQIEGTRPADAAITAFVEAAATGLGDGRVTSAFEAASGVGGDPDAYRGLGTTFARFPGWGVRTATVAITVDETIVTGTIADESTRAEIVSSLSSATGLVVRDELVVETGSTGAPTVQSPTVESSSVESSSVESSSVQSDSTLASASAPTTSPEPPTDSTLSATTIPGTSVAPPPPSNLTPVQRQVLQDELTATLRQSRIEFATDSAALTTSSKAIIADIADRLAPTGVAFEVGGHTDSRGRAERNLALSQRRADAVRDEFIRLGINPSLVTSVGYGSTKTIAPDNTPKGNPVNRRIEITLR